MTSEQSAVVQADQNRDPPLLRLQDYEDRFHQVVKPGIDYYGRVGDPAWQGLTTNVMGFRKVALRPRVLRGVERLDLSTTVLGETISMPVMLAPAGGHRRVHPDGELATARAASRGGILMALSTAATTTMEDVAAASTGPRWFQLYYFEDRRLNEELIRRAEQSGFKAIVVTVSMTPVRAPYDKLPFYGSNGPRMVDDLPISNLLGNPHVSETLTISTFMNWTKSELGWADMDWLRNRTTLPIVIKGIQTAEDAQLAVEHGMDGIVVSNHGGFAVDATRPTIAILPEVVEAVRGRTEVFVDGGVRSGTDVLKAVALGARAVLVGRPVFWGLGADGEAGLVRVIEIIRRELERDMQWCGVSELKKVERSLVTTA